MYQADTQRYASMTYRQTGTLLSVCVSRPAQMLDYLSILAGVPLSGVGRMGEGGV